MSRAQRGIQARIDGCRIDWDAFLDEFEPNELALVLSMVWDDLPEDQRVWAISTAWTGAAGGEFDIQRAEWLKMFRAVGYIDEDKPGTPPEQIKLWRGGVEKTGMSWTADRETAMWFQWRFSSHHPHGHGQPGRLWTVTVGPDRLLAHYHHQHRGEDEYVIDPTGLKVKELT